MVLPNQPFLSLSLILFLSTRVNDAESFVLFSGAIKTPQQYSLSDSFSRFLNRKIFSLLLIFFIFILVS
ncbi:hypothetical protein SAMN05192553_107144 [Cyclobacterium xiamenense]|uniref:Uncharacterized protein n=1 Tax=Cyclobacterium xiamenense TaxID=1297121 RepID=A0A1H7ANG8_9BACT|nr:hypothetical protein SAMN05192553_107144 [Cyclobacterium xiamenense]